MEEENGARRACKRAFNEVPDSVHATVGRWETELYFLLFTDRETLMSEPGLGHGTGRLRWWERKLHRTLGTLRSHSSIHRWARPYSSYAHHVCVGRGKQAGPTVKVATASVLRDMPSNPLPYLQESLQETRLGVNAVVPRPAGAGLATKITLENACGICPRYTANITPRRKLPVHCRYPACQSLPKCCT